MDLHKLRVTIILGGALCLWLLAGVFIFREPLKARVQEVRAARLMERAEAAYAAEQWAEAARLGQASHYLVPEDKRIQLFVARALLEQRSQSAVAWWKLVLDQPDLPVEELRTVAAAMLNSGQGEEALPFLSRLVELDPDSTETRRLWLQSLEQQRRYGMAMHLAGQFTESGADDWGIHRAYLLMRRNTGSGEGEAGIVEHLTELVETGGALALPAARELLVIEAASFEARSKAMAYLNQAAEDDVDRLYAASFEVREGMANRSQLTPLLDRILADPGPGALAQLLEWARWMGAEAWYLENVSWDAYQANGGAADPYLGLLLAQERYERILSLTENLTTVTGNNASAFYYYRSVALERTGEAERARTTLELSVKAIDPDYATGLERYLVRGGNWALLEELYSLQLQEKPGDPILLFKLLAADYYTGNQGSVLLVLDELPPGTFEEQPDLESFLLYLHLLAKGHTAALHQHLEILMTRYPEIFDFRLVLGVSYVLQGQAAVGAGLLEDMPELTFSAPRHLRVSAAILGRPVEDLIAPAERELLLPRESFLLSRRSAAPTR